MSLESRIRVGVVVAILAALPGCKSGSEGEAPATGPRTPPVEATAEPEPPEVTPADDPEPIEPPPAEAELDAPSATESVTWIGVVSGDEPPAIADELVVDDTALSLNGKQVLALDAGQLPADAVAAGQIAALAEALTADDEAGPRTVLVVADAQVPYRTLFTVLGTIQASSRTGVSLAGLEADTVGGRTGVANADDAPMRVLPLSLPQPRPAPQTQPPVTQTALITCENLRVVDPTGSTLQPAEPTGADGGRVLRAHLDAQGFVLTIDGRRLESLQDCPASGCPWDRYYGALLDARTKLLPETGCIELVPTGSTPMQQVVQVADITRVQLGASADAELTAPASAEALEAARPLVDATGARRDLFPHIALGAPTSALPAGQ